MITISNVLLSMCSTIIMNIMIIVMIVGKPIFVIQKVNKCNLTISNVPVEYTTYLVPKIYFLTVQCI